MVTGSDPCRSGHWTRSLAQWAPYSGAADLARDLTGCRSWLRQTGGMGGMPPARDQLAGGRANDLRRRSCQLAARRPALLMSSGPAPASREPSLRYLR